MKKTLFAMALSAPLLLSGCVISVNDGEFETGHHSSWQDREHNNREHISRLETGMSYGKVIQKMGVADFNEMVASDTTQKRILYYRTQRTKDDGITTKDECTPLVFIDDKLTGWGDGAMQDI